MDWDELREAAAAIGALLSARQAALLERMAAMLRSANSRASLMSEAALADLLRLHIFDALTLTPLLREAGLADGRLVDVGTGAGFPGLVLKIAEPGLRVTLLDATRKKTAYLQETAAALGLDADIRNARAEDAARDPSLREAFDAAVCRALGPCPVALELTLPFCRVGGLLLAQRGADSEREAAAVSKPPPAANPTYHSMSRSGKSGPLSPHAAAPNTASSDADAASRTNRSLRLTLTMLFITNVLPLFVRARRLAP